MSYKLMLLPALLVLVGCESRTADVEVKMQEIRNQQPLPIQPEPVFAPVPSYSYGGYQTKSPFVPTSIANELRERAGKRVYPNLSRPKQPLEDFTLEELVFKGIMKNSAHGIVALVQTPLGELVQVQRGSYMGQNQGRIVAIAPNKIDLVEIVPDGQDGYIERPRTLILHSGA